MNIQQVNAVRFGLFKPAKQEYQLPPKLAATLHKHYNDKQFKELETALLKVAQKHAGHVTKGNVLDVIRELKLLPKTAHAFQKDA